MHKSVLVLSGMSGVGKSHLLEQFCNANPGALKVFTPEIVGAVLDPSQVKWESVAGVAVDDCLMWDIATLPKAIAILEWQATARGKSLILVTQEFGDLSIADVRLRSNPMGLKVSGREDNLSFSYNGSTIEFEPSVEIQDKV